MDVDNCGARRVVLPGAVLDARHDAVLLASPTPDEEEEGIELDIDEVRIDEANLPRLDTEDPETLALEQAHDDLLDRRWLERGPEEADDDERSALDDLGFTIELNARGAEDEAEVVDLDVGELLDSEPPAGTEVELPLDAERGDGAFGAELDDVLLPEDDDAHDDLEVGEDERFPAFDDGAPSWRPAQGDDEGPDGEPS